MIAEGALDVFLPLAHDPGVEALLLIAALYNM